MTKIKKMKKILSVFTSAALAVGGSGITSAVIAELETVSAASAGDLNNDGKITTADVVMLQQYLTGKRTLDSYSEADTNGDGKINVFDLVSLKRKAISASVSDVNYIHLNETSITTEGSGMKLSENDTVVTISAEGTYQIDGTLTDGQIRVEAADTDIVTIILNGVNVTCSTGAPIYIENDNSTVLSLAEGSSNTLNDNEAYSGTETGSTICSGSDLVISGSGSLTVNCNNVAAGAAVIGDGNITVKSGNIKVTCAADENDEGADGIVSTSGNIDITGGKLNVNSKGGDAFKSKSGNINITGGNVTAKSEADALQAGDEINISGNSTIVNAFGKRSFTTGEGVAPSITGGTVYATSNEELSDTSGITVNSMLLGYTEKINKAEIKIQQNGTDVITLTPDKKYTYALIVDSKLSNGKYTVYTGGTQMTHANAATEGEFNKTATVTAFNSVAAVTGTVIVEPVENTIVLADSGITTTGTGTSLSADNKIVTISEPGTYTVTGDMTGGQIIVDVDKTAYPDGVVTLSLAGMSLTNTSDSPVYVAQVGDECVISVKNGTVNTIKDGSSYTNADTSAGAVYSKDDLKIKGKGTLNVYGNCEDGIVSKDDLKIYNGTINVYAADDGIRGKESVKIGDDEDTDFSNLNVTVETTSGDGIKTTDTEDTEKGWIIINGGTVNVTAKGMADGIQAERDLTINGGSVDVYTYQGSNFGSGSANNQDSNTNKTSNSAKGLKAGDSDASITGNIYINGGTINVDSSDDAIHCNGDLDLYGGNITLASADDGCHSDSNLNIGDSSADDLEDVSVYISKCYEGMEGMNINQNSGSVIVNAQDDGYNAAGGADGSGSVSPGGWNQGGRPGSTSSGNYSLNIKGGLALVNCQDGDHDGFDSNGSLNISGGYAISNGNEPFDADGTKSYTGGVYITNAGSGGMGGMGGPGGMGGSEMTSTVSNESVSISSGTRITLANGSNVIVSFVANKNVAKLIAGCTAYPNAKFYTGGNISGTPSASGGSQSIYTSGTISGGTQVG